MVRDFVKKVFGDLIYKAHDGKDVILLEHEEFYIKNGKRYKANEITDEEKAKCWRVTRRVAVTVDTFVKLFGDAIYEHLKTGKPLSEVLLKANKNSDGSEKGYSKYILKWKKEGRII